MIFRRFRKDIAVQVSWLDKRSATKSITKQVVSDADNTVITMYPDGKKLRVRVSAVKKGTVVGQFLRGGGCGRAE